MLEKLKKFTTVKNQSVTKGTQGKTEIQEGEERHDNVGKTHKLKDKCQPFNEKKMEHGVRPEDNTIKKRWPRTSHFYRPNFFILEKCRC